MDLILKIFFLVNVALLVVFGQWFIQGIFMFQPNMDVKALYDQIILYRGVTTLLFATQSIMLFVLMKALNKQA